MNLLKIGELLKSFHEVMAVIDEVKKALGGNKEAAALLNQLIDVKAKILGLVSEGSLILKEAQHLLSESEPLKARIEAAIADVEKILKDL